jgi:glycosyltransferase involved in cell wall biosynthesis
MMSDRLKVLLVITRLVPGGAQREVLELLAGLDRQRFRVSLASHPEGEWVEKGAALADAFHPIPALVRPISPRCDLRAGLDLARLLRCERPDVIHTHTSKAGMLGRMAARASRVPAVVHTPHGTVFHKTFLSAPMQRMIARMEWVAAHWTDCIITKSAHESVEYIERRIAPPEKFRVIHSGLDFPRLDRADIPSQAVRASLGAVDGRPILLYAARFVPEKDHACFLRAFEEVLESIPSAVAVLAGDGPLRKEIEARAASLIGRGALLSLGFRDDLPDLMRAADICISASLTEGLPLAVAEALALGRPVVATDAGGTREIVRDGETGLLVPTAHHAALAGAILRLLRHREYARRLGQAGQRLARGIFGVQSMIAKTTALYDEVWALSQRRGRASCKRSMREMPPPKTALKEG